MGVALPSSANWAERCNADGEFKEAARHWNGGLRLSVGDDELAMSVADGVASDDAPNSGPGVLHYEGAEDIWSGLLAAVPVADPERLTKAMVEALSTREKAVWVSVHVNHHNI